MNLNLDSIVSKLEKHGELLTLIGTAYSHEKEFGGGFGTLFGYATNDITGKGNGPLYELKYELEHPDWFLDKLLGNTTPPHLYSTAFKLGAGVWLIAELTGYLNKYKPLAEKVAKGAMLSAALMQGSGPYDQGQFAKNVIQPNANINVQGSTYTPKQVVRSAYGGAY
jgi:hypothetical protein